MTNKEKATRHVTDNVATLIAGKNLEQSRGMAIVIDEAIDIASTPEWVSISNGLPSDLDDVLVAESDSDYTTIGFYNKELNIWQDRTYDILSVTHWMPFPSPPKNHRK